MGAKSRETTTSKTNKNVHWVIDGTELEKEQLATSIENCYDIRKGGHGGHVCSTAVIPIMMIILSHYELISNKNYGCRVGDSISNQLLFYYM